MNTNNEKYWSIIKENKKNQKLCFIHTPKCGGNYVKSIVEDIGIRNKFHTPAEKNDGITFTIIRDPVDRFESLINYIIGYKNIDRLDAEGWPKHLYYIYFDKSININEIVQKMSDDEIFSKRRKPYCSLSFWCENVDICITIDKLHEFLSFFGFNYDSNKYKKLNVSNKERGRFNEETKERIRKIYAGDVKLFENKILS